MATLLSTSVVSTAYKVTQTVTGVECDICNNVIPVKDRRWDDKSDQYFEVTTGHHDWGNDSCESIETVDVCRECILKFIEDYLNDCSDTAYLELHTKTVWGRKISSEVVDKLPKEGEVTKVTHDTMYY